VSRLARTLVGPLKWGACAVAGALFVRALRGTDFSHTRELLQAAGPAVFLAILPFAVAQAFDTAAWQAVFKRLGQSLPLHRLYPIRVALEAMTLSLPAGVVVAESVGPRLLKRSLDVPASTALAAAGARRWLTMRAHAVYVGLGALAGFVVLRERPDVAALLRVGPLVVLASALLPLGASIALSTTLAGGPRVARLYAILSRIPVPALAKWLAMRKSAFVATDEGFASLARGRPLVLPTALLVVAWLCESVEAFVLFRLVGARLSFVEVLSFEAGLSVLRSAWFFAPAGLGVQDLGYLAALHAFGVPDASAVGAAFLVLKRGRELLWIALGYTRVALGTRTRATSWRQGVPST
jgi:glycosyltransferase 2 family protein